MTRYRKNLVCRKALKLAEYATDIEDIIKQGISAVYGSYSINPVFEKLIMDRIRHAS